VSVSHRVQQRKQRDQKTAAQTKSEEEAGRRTGNGRTRPMSTRAIRMSASRVHSALRLGKRMAQRSKILVGDSRHRMSISTCADTLTAETSIDEPAWLGESERQRPISSPFEVGGQPAMAQLSNLRCLAGWRSRLEKTAKAAFNLLGFLRTV